MASARKRESNKRNAQLSTGPKNTDASRFNAVTHGIFANQTYIESGLGPKERELYEALRDSLSADLAPVGTVEEMIVADIFRCAWSVHLVASYEQGLLVPKLDHRKSVEESKLEDLLKTAEEHLEALKDPGSLTGDQGLVVWLLDLLEVGWDVDVERAMSLDGDWFLQNQDVDERDIKLVVAAACAKLDVSETAFWDKIRVTVQRGRDDIVGELARFKQVKSPRHTLVDPVNSNRIMRYDSHFSRRCYQGLRELRRQQDFRRSREHARTAAIKVDFRAAGPKRPA